MSSDRDIRIAQNLRQIPKYRNVCPDTLESVARWACVRHKSDKEAVKAGRRKLHQIYGAYLSPKWASRMKRLMAELSAQDTGEGQAAVCRRILQGHSSTAERLPILAEVYQDLAAIVPQPETILDLACGFNPFARPWMGGLAEAEYIAVDIDAALLGFIAEFLESMGGRYRVELRDLILSPPSRKADLALLFKTVPCLEQLEKGAGPRLLRALKAEYVVVSFPSRSLGGIAKGMERNYREMAENLFQELGVRAEAIKYPSETFYVYRNITGG
jgi:16S rRNA (guanine(1405)-N(7))-methyltransferase